MSEVRCVVIIYQNFDTISDTNVHVIATVSLISFKFRYRTLTCNKYRIPFATQVTGELVLHLRKVCRNLKELDLARCKSVTSASVRRVFDSCPSLESLNVAFLDGVVDEAFEVRWGWG